MDQAIDIAIKNGYEDGKAYYSTLSQFKTIAPIMAEEVVRCVAVADPVFWKCLGIGLLWDSATECGSCEYPGSEEEWKHYWHKFINHLANGGDINDYFIELLK